MCEKIDKRMRTSMTFGECFHALCKKSCFPKFNAKMEDRGKAIKDDISSLTGTAER